MLMQNSPTAEKRSYIRVRTGIPVNYRVWDSEGGSIKTHATGETYTLDVGQGGVRLPVEMVHARLRDGQARLPDGQGRLGTIDLEFQAPFLIRATGRIRWFQWDHEKAPLQLGVEFIEIANEDRHRLLLFGLQQQQKPA